MKYLAAYTLLALSGKTDISKTPSSQKPQISNLSSEALDPKSATMILIGVSIVLRAKNFMS